MNPTATELYQQFTMLEASFAGLLQRCTTLAQQEQLRASYNQAWTNYNLAINKTYDVNDPRISQLHAQLINEGQNIQNALQGLQNISQTLNAIAQVIAFGTSLVLAV